MIEADQSGIQNSKSSPQVGAGASQQVELVLCIAQAIGSKPCKYPQRTPVDDLLNENALLTEEPLLAGSRQPRSVPDPVPLVPRYLITADISTLQQSSAALIYSRLDVEHLFSDFFLCMARVLVNWRQAKAKLAEILKSNAHAPHLSEERWSGLVMQQDGCVRPCSPEFLWYPGYACGSAIGYLSEP